ncbi:hypothetical protein [Dietzia lutea]|uniref:Uncharacterized protein n=1 Tax=Dietzia lutea TaxID=546160 RepID=A0A2S1RBE8_9ACTN|nr:hypothetical protein [Dietzia lutea]AWH93541.1 hypothetical protein A6035_16700 [Dietzia lutea]
MDEDHRPRAGLGELAVPVVGGRVLAERVLDLRAQAVDERRGAGCGPPAVGAGTAPVVAAGGSAPTFAAGGSAPACAAAAEGTTTSDTIVRTSAETRCFT